MPPDAGEAQAARQPSKAEVVRASVKEALGFPSASLVAGMMGFGSLVRDSGMDLGIALGATVGIWGLPGQLAFVELYAAGSEVVAIVLASSLANARFLPMGVAMLPLLQPGLRSKLWLVLYVQLMSLNSWAALYRSALPFRSDLRRLYFVTFAFVCMTAAVSGTATGYYLAGSLPRSLTLGLIFLSPVFFALLFASLKGRATALALVLGAILGPGLHLVSKDWGLLTTGLVAGSLTFWLDQKGFIKEARS